MDVHACVESGVRPRAYHAVPLARPDCTMLPRFDALLIDMDGTRVDSRALGVAPDRCIVIEDADAGIAAGLAAGWLAPVGRNDGPTFPLTRAFTSCPQPQADKPRAWR